MLLIGDRFAIVNTEEDEQPPPDRLVIRLTPSHSYGHGWADDTAKMLEAVERQVRPGDTVLDVGAGVGTLAFAALLLGAKHATATERDPDAVAALRRNVAANDVSDRVTIIDGTLPPDGPFDVVLCNIGAWEATRPHFDRLSRMADRVFVVSSEHEVRTEVQARATLHKLKLMGVGWATRFDAAPLKVADRGHGRAGLDPDIAAWAVQELVR